MYMAVPRTQKENFMRNSQAGHCANMVFKLTPHKLSDYLLNIEINNEA